jgi:hypothetical protein
MTRVDTWQEHVKPCVTSFQGIQDAHRLEATHTIEEVVVALAGFRHLKCLKISVGSTGSLAVFFKINFMRLHHQAGPISHEQV